MRLRFENMEFETSTGEAFVNNCPTGWFFEFVMQGLPAAGENIDTSRQYQLVTPWAFATEATAHRIVNLMAANTGRQLKIELADENLQFPLTVPQRQISCTENGRKARVNPGLIAARIARTTAMVGDGKGGYRTIQNSAGAIADALVELDRELNLQFSS